MRVEALGPSMLSALEGATAAAGSVPLERITAIFPTTISFSNRIAYHHVIFYAQTIKILRMVKDLTWKFNHWRKPQALQGLQGLQGPAARDAASATSATRATLPASSSACVLHRAWFSTFARAHTCLYASPSRLQMEKKLPQLVHRSRWSLSSANCSWRWVSLIGVRFGREG